VCAEIIEAVSICRQLAQEIPEIAKRDYHEDTLTKLGKGTNRCAAYRSCKAVQECARSRPTSKTVAELAEASEPKKVVEIAIDSHI